MRVMDWREIVESIAGSGSMIYEIQSIVRKPIDKNGRNHVLPW
jgi:hypothetical protein